MTLNIIEYFYTMHVCTITSLMYYKFYCFAFVLLYTHIEHLLNACCTLNVKLVTDHLIILCPVHLSLL